MDKYTRRIIGFDLRAGAVDGMALCRMFNHALRGQGSLPQCLSSDYVPLYRFHQLQANLRILEVAEIKTVPYVPLSHPCVERSIGTLRRECLNHTLFWAIADLENKLLDFKPTSTIARIRPGWGDHQTTHRLGWPRTSKLIDGNLIVEACFKNR